MNMQIEQTNLIKQQLRTGDVLNESILELYKEIPRHEFVPGPLRHFAYSDLQLELAHGQRMMTPLEEALLLQALKLTGRETVLEIGTGTGFLTALLSRLCKRVISVDYFADFTAHAKTRLAQYNCHNVELITGDASHGWADSAPYDVVIYTSAVTELTETQRLQVIPGGKLVAILGQSPIMRMQLFQIDHQKQWSTELILETCLPPLINGFDNTSFIF